MNLKITSFKLLLLFFLVYPLFSFAITVHTKSSCNDSILKVLTRTTKTPYIAINDSNSEFSWTNIKNEFNPSDDVLNDRNEAQAVLAELDLKDTWVNTIANEDIVTLPVGIKSTISEVEYSIGIAKATIHKDYTELTVFARVRPPASASVTLVPATVI